MAKKTNRGAEQWRMVVKKKVTKKKILKQTQVFPFGFFANNRQKVSQKKGKIVENGFKKNMQGKE